MKYIALTKDKEEKSMNVEKNKFLSVLKEWIVFLIIPIFYIVVSAVYVYNFIMFYSISYDSSKSVSEVVYNELGNGFTVSLGILGVIGWGISLKNKKINKFLSGYLISSIFILYCFGKCASEVNLTVSFVAFIFFFFYVLSIVVIICLRKEVIVLDKNALRNALNKITNRKILSVQLFEVDTITEGEYIKYKFKSLESMSRENCNVNGILSAEYKIKSTYITGLKLVQILYEKIVDDGEPNEINELINEIQMNKQTLLMELKKITVPDAVTEEDCCIARIYVLYLTLEYMLKNSSCTGIKISDGILELDNLDIEKRLFSFIRTGILGSLLLESNKIYTFDYHKSGKKAGRKYASFMVDNFSKKRELLCLCVIREDDKDFVSGDALKAVSKVEKNILDALAVS